MLEILYNSRRGIVLSYNENKGTDKLCSYCTADLRLCFCLGKSTVFSCCGSFDSLFKDLRYIYCQLCKYSDDLSLMV